MTGLLFIQKKTTPSGGMAACPRPILIATTRQVAIAPETTCFRLKLAKRLPRPNGTAPFKDPFTTAPTVPTIVADFEVSLDGVADTFPD
jgi:hypothetical protein